MLIDVHVHHSPKAYTDAMARYSGASRSAGWSKQLVARYPDRFADVASNRGALKRMEFGQDLGWGGANVGSRRGFRVAGCGN